MSSPGLLNSVRATYGLKRVRGHGLILYYRAEKATLCDGVAWPWLTCKVFTSQPPSPPTIHVLSVCGVCGLSKVLWLGVVQTFKVSFLTTTCLGFLFFA